MRLPACATLLLLSMSGSLLSAAEPKGAASQPTDSVKVIAQRAQIEFTE